MQIAVTKQEMCIDVTAHAVNWQLLLQYYSFTTDGDQMFLLGDNTVAHT